MTVDYLERPGKPRLAYVHTPASGKGAEYPIILFMGGYRSDMNGTKATYLETQARTRGQAYARFDYGGHGLSEGDFEAGTIGAWKEDALAIFDLFAEKPAVIAGSSMGGWIALLCALERREKVKGLVGIAAAPDFTEEIYAHLDEAGKKELIEKGAVAVPNDGVKPYEFTRRFYEEAKSHLLLDRSHNVNFPIRLAQGKRDAEVPWKTALKIKEKFVGGVEIAFIEDGDHRLSRPQDLAVIDRLLREVSEI